MKRVFVLLVVAQLLWCPLIHALTLEEIDPDQEWRIRIFTIEGNEQFSTAQLRQEMVTETRPWYTPWRSLPRFDPVTFATDIERLQRFYQAQGYYQAHINYDLEVNTTDSEIRARITIEEGQPVHVSQLTLTVTDQPALLPELQTLRPSLPLTEEMVFTEERYQEAEARIKAFLLDLHHGRAKVERKATVILEPHQAHVQYSVEAGPVTVFGNTTIEGTKQIDPELVARELMYKPGELFSVAAINNSRKNILKLDLFSSVRFIQEESPHEPRIIPMRVQVSEKPFREWQAGIGFSTEDQIRGQVRWIHNNWFGGGRRLDMQVRASFLTRNIDVSFIQPHALGPANRFTLTFRPQQLDEPSYLLNMVRLQPRFERNFTPQLSGFLGYRLEYDRLNNVTSATASELQEFQRKGTLSGISAGFVWSTVDDPLNATGGGLLSFTTEQVGGGLGGDFEFVKFVGEARKYYLIAPKTVLAGRLKLGFADPSGKSEEVPLFERFFAGGINSVRGYGRYRLGPISASNDPVGGRSLLEGSLEVRRQFTEKIGGTLFLDFGQVSLKSYDVPIDNLKFATGVGALYTTPIGPLLLGVGFPFDPPHQDQPWHVFFSIGQFF